MSLSIKHFAFATVLFMTVGMSSSFAATNNGGDDAATASFRKNFKKAEILTTEVVKNFTKLTFKMNGVVMFAFYSENGELLAVTRNIPSSQLPIHLQMLMKKNYASYWISDLFEYNGDGVSNYYITLENADTSITLRSNGSEWEVYSRKEKE